MSTTLFWCIVIPVFMLSVFIAFRTGKKKVEQSVENKVVQRIVNKHLPDLVNERIPTKLDVFNTEAAKLKKMIETIINNKDAEECHQAIYAFEKKWAYDIDRERLLAVVRDMYDLLIKHNPNLLT